MLEFRTLGRLDLRGPDGHAINSVLAHPKRVALLAYLAVARNERCYRRDTVLGIFWPDMDGERARASLRKAIHFLRRALGPEALQSCTDDEICLTAGAVSCDAASLLEAADRGAYEEALLMYRGDFMEGFFLPDSAEFDIWLEEQRVRIRRTVFDGATTLARQAEAAGDVFAAALWARRALELAPVDETALRRLMTLLDRLGDRAGAVAAYEDFARRLQRDYELETSHETRALVRAIRDRTEAFPVEPLADAAPSNQSAAWEVPRMEVAPVARRRRHRYWLAGAIAAAFALVVLAAWALFLPADEPLGPLAVGEVHDYTGTGSNTLAGPLGDMLATNLARVRSLTVISSARLYELTGDTADASAGVVMSAARRAGASQLVEGTVYRQAGDQFRFDVRVINLRSGTLRAVLSVQGGDVFTLVDRATAELATALGEQPLAQGIADVTTKSLTAYRFYEEGLRELYQRGDAAAAQRLFRAALREDSSFAMASYYAYRTEVDLRDVGVANLQRAMRHAQRASERERLLIVSTARRAWSEPGALAPAETLSIRYPAEPDGHYILGESLVEAGEFMRAVPHLRRVIDMERTASAQVRPRFRAHDAYGLLISAYMHADSFAAARRTAREYVNAYPQSVLALRQLAGVLIHEGSTLQGAALLREAERLAPQPAAATALQKAQVAIRARDFTGADSLLAPVRREGAQEDRWSAEWWLMISLREQGRLREALAIAQQRAGFTNADHASSRLSVEAQILTELGRYTEAARLYELSAAASPWAAWQRGKHARHRAWRLTHAATAYALAGDTTRVQQLVDSVRRIGQQSGYGRDWKLHHYIEGLVRAARGRMHEAARSYQAAIFSPTAGFTRTNYELARVSLSAGKPAVAVDVLQPAFRGPLEASNMYVTRTELHEQLARAFDALAQRDSARAHYRAVVNALQRADPEWRARRVAAEVRLRELGG